MKNIYDDKQEATKQWTNDPCGISRVRDLPEGSKVFYEAIDNSRYEMYAPWMKPLLGFDKYPSKKVLEVGFGMGTDLFQFAKGGSDVTGIDLSPKHLEIASQRFSLFGIDADLRLADAENMPFDDNSFDVVYSFGVIHHTPDTQRSINEIYRVLKPGGRAIIGVYHIFSAFYFFCILWPYLWKLRFLKESYRRTLSRIENRQNSDACPLVKLYSRSKLKQLFQKYRDTEIQCVHLKKLHFGPLSLVLPRSIMPKIEQFFGWYLIVQGVK